MSNIVNYVPASRASSSVEYLATLLATDPAQLTPGWVVHRERLLDKRLAYFNDSLGLAAVPTPSVQSFVAEHTRKEAALYLLSFYRGVRIGNPRLTTRVLGVPYTTLAELPLPGLTEPTGVAAYALVEDRDGKRHWRVGARMPAELGGGEMYMEGSVEVVK